MAKIIHDTEVVKFLNSKDMQKLILEKVLDEVRAFWQYTANCHSDSTPTMTITRNSVGASVSVTDLDNKVIS